MASLAVVRELEIDEGGEPSSDTWETPAHVIALAKQLMGGIDLDPASSAQANRTVGAARYFTREDDGLAQAWGPVGTIWCNPPYSKRNNVSQAALFLAKMLDEHRRGMFYEGLLLVNVSTGASWFHRLWGLPLCFCYKRLRFSRNGHDGGSPKYDNVIAYVGSRPGRFAEVFGPLGHIVLPVGAMHEGAGRC